MNEHSEDFNALAEEAGLPTTEADITAKFDALRDSAGLTITNNSAFSPFWRFIKAACITVALWLVGFVINQVLRQAFVKTATGKMLELHAWAVNLTRKLAVKASGKLLFTRDNSSGELLVPAGTIISSLPINEVVYQVKTLADELLNDGELIREINVAALSVGAAFNLAENTYTVLPDNLPGIASVTNSADWLSTPGADEELDDDLRARIVNQFTAVNQWHTDAVYTAQIASFEGVTTNNIYFEHNAPRGPGTANAYIMLEQGNPCAEFIAEIQSHITDSGNHGHGDDLKLYAMPETQHTVTATVWPADNLTDQQKTDLLTGVENFTRAAFRENASYQPTLVLPWSLFSFSLLSQELHAKFPNLKNIGFNLTHITSANDIPRLQSLTVAEHA